MSSSTNYVCHACKTGYVLNNAGTNCVTYTKDQNCMQADSTGQNCKKCWWPFWFNEKLCSKSYINIYVSIMVVLIGFLAHILTV